MDDGGKIMWQIAEARTEEERLDLLTQGWVPFAATYVPGRLMSTGVTVYHFKRIAQSFIIGARTLNEPVMQSAPSEPAPSEPSEPSEPMQRRHYRQGALGILITKTPGRYTHDAAVNRCVFMLQKAGYRTLADVRAASDEGLLNVPGIGVESLATIKALVRERV
jgi:hypothetical protein